MRSGGDVMLTVGGVVSPPPPPPPAPEGTMGDVASLLIVTGAEMVWLPEVSVATACTWYAAGASEPVTHQMLPVHDVPLHVMVPKTLPLPQSLISRKPTLSFAAAKTSMLPPVQAPFGGDVMLTVGGVVSPPPPPPPPAPDGTIGDVASLLIVTGAEMVWLPDVSVATACTWYAAGAREPVTHQMLPLHDAPLQVMVPNTLPLPQSLISRNPTLSFAVAKTSMLPPVQAPFGGDVMLTVGGVVSPPPPPPLETMTVMLAVLVLPAASRATAFSVWVPSGTAVEFHDTL